MLFNTSAVEQDPRARLFTLLSENSAMAGINHPLCESCCESLIDKIERCVKQSEAEKNSLQQFLQTFDFSSLLIAGGGGGSSDGQQQQFGKKPLTELENELKMLQEQEKTMANEQQYLEVQVVQAEKVVLKLQHEFDDLRRERQVFYGERARLSKEMYDSQDELESIERQIAVTQQRLSTLCRTNVFNEAFHILPQEHFGTINGLRLGRLKNVTPAVEWTEINAAWGETALLLHCLARKTGLVFERYELAPYGSYSFIRLLQPQPQQSQQQQQQTNSKQQQQLIILPLYNSVSHRIMPDSKFDDAMKAFLDLLAQLKQHIENRDANFRLPYDINVKDGKLIDPAKPSNVVSIKCRLNAWDQWTRALKWVLVNLRWAMTWVEHLEASEQQQQSSST